MKKKNFALILIALFAALMVPLSCKKDLTQTSSLQSSQLATFQHSQDVVALVNSIYDGYQVSDFLKKSLWYYANFFSHDWYNDGGDIAWNSYTISPTFGAIDVMWKYAYTDIGRANTAITVIPQVQAKGIVDPVLGARLLGEAYYMRGMTYYYLAGTFGGVPIELKPGGDGLTPRSTQDQVFAQVVSDMKQAETLLNSKTTLPASELGRATKGAAYAYEGSAQMWLKNYTAALAAFNNPELTSNYHLLNSFLQVHEFTNQNNDESLFEVQFDIQGSQSWDGGWFPGGETAWIDDFSWPHEISGFGYDYGNPGLSYSYQAGDKRKIATIVGPGDSLISPGIIAKWGGIKGYPVVISRFASGYKENASQQYSSYAGDDGKIINTCGSIRSPWYGDDLTRSGYYCAKKWRDPNLTGGNGNAIFGSQNQILMRYAEVLLSRAECKVHTGDIPGAMADLQLVRDRAWGKNSGGTAAPAVMQDGLTYDGKPTQPITDPLQMVLSEYRHELTGEFSLFYLLRRAGPGVAAAFIHTNYNTNSDLNPETYPFGPTADGKLHGVWFTALPANKDICPIPQPEIGLNPNLTQNPGY